MYAYIFDSRDGELLETYVAEDDLSPITYAHRYADQCDCSIVQDGKVPYGCGDIDVKIADEPFSVCCWNSASYFLEF